MFDQVFGSRKFCSTEETLLFILSNIFFYFLSEVCSRVVGVEPVPRVLLGMTNVTFQQLYLASSDLSVIFLLSLCPVLLTLLQITFSLSIVIFISRLFSLIRAGLDIDDAKLRFWLLR